MHGMAFRSYKGYCEVITFAIGASVSNIGHPKLGLETADEPDWSVLRGTTVSP
jgi:hypothetical protein